jgi:cbb3-type cytochrome oxidase subunit 3
MYRSFYEGLHALAWLPQVTTLFFALAFVAAVTWALRRDFKREAALPLDDEEKQS